MSAEEKVKAFIEVLKIVAWPAIVGWIIWYLRDEIKRAGSRIIELGPAGARFAPPPEQVPTQPTTGVSAAVQPASTLTTGASPPSNQPASAQQLIEQIRAVISPDQLDPAVQAIRSDPKLAGADQAARIEVLTYTAAALNVQLVHERTYAAIFGSQLQLLAQMNVDVGVPPSVARQVYDAAKTANPEVYRNYTFEQWIGFLRNSGLISIAPKGNYVLTPWGRGLLRYIVDRHLSVNKPF